MNAILIGVLVYIGLQLLIGVLVSRRIASETDYLLAGRSLGFGLATFSFFATWFGAETCIASAGALYERGLAGAAADPFGYGACLLIMGFVFAIPLWRRNLTTLGDLFRTRYSRKVEVIAVLMMAPTSILWAAAQIRAFGQVMSASSSIGPTMGMTIGLAVAVVYTAWGGLRADVMTDLLQGIVIIIGLAVLWFSLFPDASAVSTAWSGIKPERLQLFGGGDSGWMSLEKWAVPICGSVVAQELVARALATRSPQIARNAALAGGVFYILVGMVPAFIGLVGAQWFPALQDPEQILPAVARQHLSTLGYIIFAGALLSAILSTVDSTLLAASALVSHNLLIPLRPGMPEKTKLKISRFSVVGAGVIVYVLALQAESIYALVENASAFGSAGIFVVVVFGLFSSVGGQWSALAALLSGISVWVIGKILEWNYPYLAALTSAFIGYLLFAGLKTRGERLSSPDNPLEGRV